MKPGTEGLGSGSDGVRSETDQNDSHDGVQMDTEESGDFEKKTIGTLVVFKRENGNREEEKSRFQSLSMMDVSQSESSDVDSSEDSKLDVKKHTNSLILTQDRHIGGDDVKVNLKEEHSDEEQSSEQEQVFSFDSEHVVKAETQDPSLNVSEHSYTGRSPSSPVKLGVRMEDATSTRGHQTSPCLDCLKRNICETKPPEDAHCCGTSRPATHLPSETPRNLGEERTDNKIWTKKKKQKKKRARELLPGLKRDHKHPQHGDSLRPPPTEAAKSVVRKVSTTIKRKDKTKKYKTGKKTDYLKKVKEESPPAPSFKLVCSNLDELRELISKTEDELDVLESMKKRLGRWYYKKEAVKELHSTLIRLLNELLPWEPKLVKAYQRNRLRLKKENDDFKKHPEYSNFVREECVSSSSSSSSSDDEDDYEETDMENIHCRVVEEEDQEHVVPRGLWSGASSRESGAESAAEKTVTISPSNHLKHPLVNKERGYALLPGVYGVFNSATSADWRTETKSGLASLSPSGDLSWAAGILPHTCVSPTSPILNPMCKLPPGYTPIPTLLAKSVGNKVTLMRRPTDFPGASAVERQLKGSLVSLPSSAATKVSNTQSFPSSGNHISQQMTTKAPLQTISTGALPKTPQGALTRTEPKSPIQVVCKVSEGVGHLVKKDSSSPVKIPAHSVVDKNTVEKVMQQVLFLPSGHLIPKNETQATVVSPPQSTVIQVAVSKVATPGCISTDVPGFRIPDGKIPVQQVAPLTGNPAPSGSSFLQQGARSSTRLKGPQVCTVKTSTLKGGLPTPSTVTAATRAAVADTAKLTEPKQELKTVCIRDSQSILVTTRGGNTGIVKVQTSSEHNSLGSFSTSPVITISPQLKAFLVSKTSTALAAPIPSQASRPTVQGGTSTSAAQTQNHGPLALPASHAANNSTPTTVTSSTPVRGLASKTTRTAAPLGQGSSNSPVSVVTNISQLVNTATYSSPFPSSTLKNTVVPSLSSGVSKAPTQEAISKNGVKRSSTNEISQVTKYILVTSSSSASSNQPTSKRTPSSSQSAASSKVVLVSQPAVTTSTTFMGAIPKLMMGVGSGQALTTPLSNPNPKMGISPAKPVACVSSEASSKASNSTLQAGVAVPLLGKSTTVGQTVSALSYSPSKASPVPISGIYNPTAATTTGVLPNPNLFTVTNRSTQLDTCTSLQAALPIQGIPSTSVISQTSCPSSTAPIMLAENINGKELCVPATTPSSSSPVQVTSTLGNCPGQMRIDFPDQIPLPIKSGMSEAGTPVLSSSQTACNKTHPPLSSAPTTYTTFSTSTTGPVTQKIIINTSTHLTAGTQIVLNNACFVVPPQGLGPGSHVLIISNPAPQVPAGTSTSTEAFVPPRGTSPAIVTPQAPGLSQSAARQPSMPTVSSPFVACTPALGQSLLASTSHVTPFRLTGTPGMGSTVIPSKTNVVSALPRVPPAHGGNFVLPPVCTSTLISSPPRLGSVPVLSSPVKTTTPSLSSALSPIRVTGGAIKHANFSSTITSAVSTSLPRLSEPLTSLPGLLGSSTGALHNPVTAVPAAIFSDAASIVTNTAALRCSPSGQRVDATLGSVISPGETAVKVAKSLTVHPQGLVQAGPGKMPIKTGVPIVQPALSGIWTQELPTVAVPPLLSPATRTQALPIATVPPIGSTISTFEMASAASAPSAGTTLVTPTPPVTSLMTKSTISPPVILTNQELKTNCVQTSALGMHATLPSRLLVGADGAVLSTGHCQVNQPQKTGCPKPWDALTVSPYSSSGVLRTHGSTLQPHHRDTK